MLVYFCAVSPAVVCGLSVIFHYIVFKIFLFYIMSPFWVTCFDQWLWDAFQKANNEVKGLLPGFVLSRSLNFGFDLSHLDPGKKPVKPFTRLFLCINPKCSSKKNRSVRKSETTMLDSFHLVLLLWHVSVNNYSERLEHSCKALQESVDCSGAVTASWLLLPTNKSVSRQHITSRDTDIQQNKPILTKKLWRSVWLV